MRPYNKPKSWERERIEEQMAERWRPKSSSLQAWNPNSEPSDSGETGRRDCNEQTQAHQYGWAACFVSFDPELDLLYSFTLFLLLSSLSGSTQKCTCGHPFLVFSEGFVFLLGPSLSRLVRQYPPIWGLFLFAVRFFPLQLVCHTPGIFSFCK